MKLDSLLRLHLPDEAATLRLGAEIGTEAFPGLLVRLTGPLGTGKTTLVRGMVDGMGGVPFDVSSPSFTIVNVYETRRGTLLHADLYRLGSAPFIDDTGIHEALEAKDAVVAVEWAERINLSWYPALTVELDYHGDGPSRSRTTVISAAGKGKDVLDSLNSRLAGTERMAF